MKAVRWGLALCVVASATVAPGASAASPTASSERPCPDWGMYGRGFARTFSTACPSAVDTTSVRTMLPAWFVKTKKTVTASPVVAGGVLYVGDWSGTMYAIDARAGTVRWTFQTPPAPGSTFGPIVSSAAVAQVRFGAISHQLIVFGAGPRLFALDPTGRVVWTRYVGATDTHGRPRLRADVAEILSSPLIWNDTVYVGMDTHDHPASQTGGVGGGLLAIDVRTGKTRWKFEPDPHGSGCGGVWSSPTLDARRRVVYVGTANCHGPPSAWTPAVESITAVDAITGERIWSFQPHGPNRRDEDFGATPNLFTDGAGRPVLGAGNKDGTYYALDPVTGKRRWATHVAAPGDVQEDFAIGGFIGSSATWKGRIFGTTAIGGPPYFHAIDGRTGRILWRGVQAPSYAPSAAVNGVVFTGALDAMFRALDARTGLTLWTAPLLGPISSGPAITEEMVYVGSGTSSSDACVKEAGPLFDACLFAFDQGLGRTGGVHAFRVG